MPIYDYKCNKCSAEFEVMVKQESKVVCENCKSPETVKLLTAPRASGVVLMGEGFYKKSPSSW